jgi:hypothetical protein
MYEVVGPQWRQGIGAARAAQRPHRRAAARNDEPAPQSMVSDTESGGAGPSVCRAPNGTCGSTHMPCSFAAAGNAGRSSPRTAAPTPKLDLDANRLIERETGECIKLLPLGQPRRRTAAAVPGAGKGCVRARRRLVASHRRRRQQGPCSPRQQGATGSRAPLDGARRGAAAAQRGPWRRRARGQPRASAPAPASGGGQPSICAAGPWRPWPCPRPWRPQLGRRRRRRPPPRPPCPTLLLPPLLLPGCLLRPLPPAGRLWVGVVAVVVVVRGGGARVGGSTDGATGGERGVESLSSGPQTHPPRPARRRCGGRGPPRWYHAPLHPRRGGAGGPARTARGRQHGGRLVRQVRVDAPQQRPSDEPHRVEHQPDRDQDYG